MLFHLPSVNNQRLFELRLLPTTSSQYRVAIDEELSRRLDQGEVKQSTVDSKTFKFIR